MLHRRLLFAGLLSLSMLLAWSAGRQVWPAQVGGTGSTGQCSDGLDNDSDGSTDFPEDFSCDSANDTDEKLPMAQCQDLDDNDGDGFADFREPIRHAGAADPIGDAERWKIVRGTPRAPGQGYDGAVHNDLNQNIDAWRPGGLVQSSGSGELLYGKFLTPINFGALLRSNITAKDWRLALKLRVLDTMPLGSASGSLTVPFPDPAKRVYVGLQANGQRLELAFGRDRQGRTLLVTASGSTTYQHTVLPTGTAYHDIEYRYKGSLRVGALLVNGVEKMRVPLVAADGAGDQPDRFLWGQLAPGNWVHVANIDLTPSVLIDDIGCNDLQSDNEKESSVAGPQELACRNAGGVWGTSLAPNRASCGGCACRGLMVPATANDPKGYGTAPNRFRCLPSECSDGIDNDGDALIDFSFDPGCEDSMDIREQDPMTVLPGGACVIVDVPNGGDAASVRADCPGGYEIMGGGWSEYGGTDQGIDFSRPNGEGWECETNKAGDARWESGCQAVCCDARIVESKVITATGPLSTLTPPQCEAGYTVTGGGFTDVVQNKDEDFLIPTVAGDGWRCTDDQSTSGESKCFAVCAKSVTPTPLECSTIRVPGPQETDVAAQCPTGTIVTGGGFVDASNGNDDEDTSMPVNNGWVCQEDYGDGRPTGPTAGSCEARCCAIPTPQMCGSKVLLYALQPTGTSAAFEAQLQNLEPIIAGKGKEVVFANRASQPTLSHSFLGQFSLVMLANGCGFAGSTFSAVEMDALYSFYLAGGSIVLIGDDAIGDGDVLGSCHGRVNKVAEKLGMRFGGTVTVTPAPNNCAQVTAVTSPILQGLTSGLGRKTGALLTSTELSWGSTAPIIVGTVGNPAVPAAGFIPKTSEHGAVLFDPDFASTQAGCSLDRYVTNILAQMATGCNVPPASQSSSSSTGTSNSSTSTSRSSSSSTSRSSSTSYSSSSTSRSSSSTSRSQSTSRSTSIGGTTGTPGGTTGTPGGTGGASASSTVGINFSSFPGRTEGECDGTECRIGGSEYCALIGKSCGLTATLPCMQCIDTGYTATNGGTATVGGTTGQTGATGNPIIGSVNPLCGNGRVNPGEECDDFNRIDFDGCSQDCLLETGRCGDGIVQSLLDEQCEPSTHDPALPYLCDGRCHFYSFSCGDGRADPGEQCDDDARNSDAPDAQCRSNCSVARCGDGIVDARSETCDDGNRLSGDGCSKTCLLERGAPLDGNTGTGIGSAVVYTLPTDGSAAQWINPVHAPVGNTGPAAIAVMAAGAATGLALVRRAKGRKFSTSSN